ncbi:hypothetical protein GCM10027280_59650 [Micromonospora polyrhachis]|uniref:Transposase InsO family protein n=1 Tax=Micromonospora polyrhachis TaxID=1282883 RepID=A0A7W7SUJ5_9ACTN|nr:transposase InsO family protein [Micromonospora polyrhachis]
MPRSYPPEFRRKVLDLLKAGRSVADLVRDLNRQRWRTRIELANAIFEYLEIFHNRQRRHSSLGMLSPTEYERVRPISLSVA